ncbi:hypothetical protein LTR37_010933 [Vermiconidia calcicola]|uniref:Uncharacterized protein n=1 Tax=Vermiconidia calcicola TaxID=1690605 RepID=A0ACC3N3K9_9PEZI|nr:hypothetical protein LTR37_010933 [Vermiconidia calcicola]
MAQVPAVTTTVDDASQKKKTRLNPARRKAMRSKTEPARSIADTTAPSDLSAGKKPQATSTQAPRNVQTDAPKQNPAWPPSLSRQNTEPGLAKSKPQPKPNLVRTITAPEANNKGTSLALKAPALTTGGLVGCAASAAILLGVGIWYDFSGAESAILAAKAAKLCVDNLTEDVITSLQAGTYSADEALDIHRRTTLAYASTIPGGAPFVERIFREIDMVRKQRGREVDKVVAETYAELAKAGSKGATSAEMQTIVIKQLMTLSSFASNATQDVVARNPKLRPFRDGAVKSLQEPSDAKMPTVKVNMAIRQKQTIGK